MYISISKVYDPILRFFFDTSCVGPEDRYLARVRSEGAIDFTQRVNRHKDAKVISNEGEKCQCFLLYQIPSTTINHQTSSQRRYASLCNSIVDVVNLALLAISKRPVVCLLGISKWLAGSDRILHILISYCEERYDEDQRTEDSLLQHMGEYSMPLQESGDSSGVIFLPVDLVSVSLRDLHEGVKHTLEHHLRANLDSSQDWHKFTQLLHDIVRRHLQRLAALLSLLRRALVGSNHGKHARRGTLRDIWCRGGRDDGLGGCWALDR